MRGDGRERPSRLVEPEVEPPTGATAPWFGLTVPGVSPTMPGRFGMPINRSPIHLANACPGGTTNQERFRPLARGNAV